MTDIKINREELCWLLITSWRYSASRHTYAPSMTLELLKKYRKFLDANDLMQIKSEAEWVLGMRKLEQSNDIDNLTLQEAIKFVDKELEGKI